MTQSFGSVPTLPNAFSTHNAFSTSPTLAGVPPPGSMQSIGPTFATNPTLAGVPPPGSMQSVGPSFGPSFSMQSMTGGAPPAFGGVPMLGEVVLEITRLLDMPIQQAFNGDPKQYRVKAFDDNNTEIGRTEELAGMPESFNNGGDADTETIRLGAEGILRLQTDSAVIHLQVEYAGGFLGNMRIGRCQIARSDQRSRQVWPYALSNKKNELVGCGIELKVVQDGPMGGPGMMPTGPMGPPIGTMPPNGMGMMPTMPRNGPMATMPPGSNMGPMGPMGPNGVPMTMPPNGPMATMPPMSMGGPPMMGPGGTPPGTPPGSMRSFPGMGPNGPSFQTMPPSGLEQPPPYGMGPPVTSPRGGPNGPSFHTMPHMAGSQMQMQGGGGSFMQPPMSGPMGVPMSGPMMPPGSGPMMSGMNPMMTNPMMSNPMMGHPMMTNPASTRSCKVKWAVLNPSGKNVTDFVNQLIHANGIFDPTRGSTIEAVFKSHEELSIHGPGVAQAEYPGGGTSIKDFPLTFPSGAKPPYNLFALFNPAGLPPVSHSHMMPSNPAAQNVFVVALIDIEKIIDLPAPSGGGEGEVTLTLERPHAAGAGTGKEISSIGPFKVETKGGLSSVGSCDGKLVARLAMMDLAQGAVEFRVCASYKGGWTSFGRAVQIGATAPFYVTWKPEPTQFVPLLEAAASPLMGRAAGKAVGGIYLSHRFVQDSPDVYKQVNPGAKSTTAKNNLAKQPEEQQNGKSGKFQKGGQEEVLEVAALAVEGQNRALHQRVMIAKSAKQIFEDRQKKDEDAGENAMVIRYPNGYRNWKNLDSVFITMGPNYVAQSSEIGVPMCKSYEDKSTVWKELTKKTGPTGLGVPRSPAEEAKFKELIYTLYKKNPEIQTSTLRPVVCKNVDTIDRGELDAAKRQPRLSVKVHSGLHLGLKKNGQKVNPKVIVEIPGKPTSRWTNPFGAAEKVAPSGKFETKPAQDADHAEWNQEGVLSGYTYGDELRILVVHQDFLGWDDHLLEARLPGNDFYPEPFFAQLPLFNPKQASVGMTPQGPGVKSPSLLLEVKVIEPGAGEEVWPPTPAMYAPMWDVNQSDAETQRLANWDIHQNAKLAFADVSTNYQMNEDIWGALETNKATDEGSGMHAHRPDWKPQRIKDECLMA